MTTKPAAQAATLAFEYGQPMRLSGEHTFSTELAARRFTRNLEAAGYHFSYWHRSICEHIVTVRT